MDVLCRVASGMESSPWPALFTTGDVAAFSGSSYTSTDLSKFIPSRN